MRGAWDQVQASVGRELIGRHRIDVIRGFNLARGGLTGRPATERNPGRHHQFGELVSKADFFHA